MVFQSGLPTPPSMPAQQRRGVLASLSMPLTTGATSLLFVAMHPTPAMLLVGGVTASITVIFTVTQIVSQRRVPRRQLQIDRARYFDQLAACADEANEKADARSVEMRRDHPDATALPLVAGDSTRRWTLHPGHPGWGKARIGTTAPTALFDPAVFPSAASLVGADPICIAALQALRARTVPSGEPFVADVFTRSPIVIGGAPGLSSGTARAIVCRLAVSHAPTALRFTVRQPDRSEWAWVSRLPHRGAIEVTIDADTELVAGWPSHTDLDAVGVATATLIAAELARHEPRVDLPALGELRAHIGNDANGHPVVLDINEPSLGGVGPHGLCVGATGSGKSELLRTIVAGLAAIHSPDRLAFVLVDWKGGAAFADLDSLPHVAGVITNLADDAPLVERARVALMSEVTRRQQLLADADRCPTAHEYRERLSGGMTGEALPSLLVVVDEFAELLAAAPDFLDVFGTIGRVGRSLGMHLLLASQRIDDGRLNGLDAHLSYRVCLRTQCALDSRAAIGVPDAAALPLTPGVALLATGTAAPVRFQVLRSQLPMPNSALRTRTIWLAPLPSTIAATHLGMVDQPERQFQGPFDIALGRNLAIVGRPGSGSTNALCAFALSQARTLSPADLAMHIIDANGGLAMIHGMPHVASVCTSRDTELAHQVVEHLRRSIDTQISARHATLLLIDGWDRVRLLWPELAEPISDLARCGPSAGLSVALTTTRWTSLPAATRDSISDHLELALADPFDSVHPRRVSASVTGIPGRAINTAGDLVQIAYVTEDDIAVITAAFPWQRAEPIPVLPLLVHSDSLRAAPPGQVAIGVAQPDNLPCSITLEAGEPHLAVVGDNGSGVSNLLRLLVRGLTLDGTRERAFAVVDYRGSVIDTVPNSLLAGVAGEARGACALIDTVAGEAARRLAPPRLSRRDRSQRSWWTGPDIYVVVDDDDLVSTGSNQPLIPLIDLLAFGHEIGLHLVIARRVNGASHAIHTPVWRALRELGCPAFTLSGDPSEGPLLHGHRARTLPRGRATELRRGAAPRMVQTALFDADQPARPSTCAS